MPEHLFSGIGINRPFFHSLGTILCLQYILKRIYQKCTKSLHCIIGTDTIYTSTSFFSDVLLPKSLPSSHLHLTEKHSHALCGSHAAPLLTLPSVLPSPELRCKSVSKYCFHTLKASTPLTTSPSLLSTLSQTACFLSPH